MRYHPPTQLTDACFALLIRHGATENNDARPPRLQGRRLDPGLSDKGRRQAEWTAEALAAHRIAAVFSSPLRRAVETADLIARLHGLEVQAVDGLIECDVGNWEGRSWEEIAVSEPEAYRAFMDDAEHSPYAGGESLAQVCGRALPAIEHIVERYVGQTVAIVAHNVVNRVLLARLVGLRLAQARGIDQQNCGVNVLRWQKGKLSVHTANASFHLEAW